MNIYTKTSSACDLTEDLLPLLEQLRSEVLAQGNYMGISERCYELVYDFVRDLDLCDVAHVVEHSYVKRVTPFMEISIADVEQYQAEVAQKNPHGPMRKRQLHYAALYCAATRGLYNALYDELMWPGDDGNG